MTSKKIKQNSSKPQERTGTAAPEPPTRSVQASKLDLMLTLLRQPKGASLMELAAATGWQSHSVRGALAGTLRKKGHTIVSERSDGERRYRIEVA